MHRTLDKQVQNNAWNNAKIMSKVSQKCYYLLAKLDASCKLKYESNSQLY